MKINLRMECFTHPDFKEIGNVQNTLQQQLNDSLQDENLNTDLHIAFRIFPKQRFIDYALYYQPVEKYSQKSKSVVFTFDINFEEMENKNNVEIFEILKKGITASIRKLKKYKIEKVDEMEKIVQDLAFEN